MEAILIQTVHTRTRWPESTSQSISLLGPKLKSYGWSGCFCSSRRCLLPRCNFRRGRRLLATVINHCFSNKVSPTCKSFINGSFFTISLCALWQDIVSPFSNNGYLTLEQNVQGLLLPNCLICHSEDFIKCLRCPVFIKRLRCAL